MQLILLRIISDLFLSEIGLIHLAGIIVDNVVVVAAAAAAAAAEMICSIRQV
jgi:hypothetical protein